MKNAKKLLALILAVVMCLGLVAGCAPAGDTDATPTPGQTQPQNTDKPEEPKTLVYGEDQGIEGKFSPFFYAAVTDENVVNMVHLSLLSVDREGNVVLKAIEGETRPYNGTDYTYTGIADFDIVENADGSVDYNITLKQGIKFSDGEEATIDDVIFGMYVLSDPTYDGSSTLYAVPIKGMAEYRSGMESLCMLLAKAGKDNTDFSLWDEATQTKFWDEALPAAGEAWLQTILDYVVANGYAAADDPVAVQAAQWGWDSLAEDATLTDLWNLVTGDLFANYDNDYDTLSSVESASASLWSLMPSEFQVGINTGNSAPNIAGIKKTGDYSMTITTDSFEATSIYQFSLPLAPMHYYGDESLYDYENNKFGFNKGDLSIVKDKTTQPMGAGPYLFKNFANGQVNFEANPLFYKGEPKIKYVNFQELADADKVGALETGTVDVTSPSFSNEVVEQVTQINGTEDYNGDVITINAVDYLGYGYIGMCARNIKVGDDPSSEQSKDLRKAIATVLAVTRDVAIESYYGKRATVINYPISNTSWAAPRITDEGYEVAFSKNVNGEPIYTDGMSTEEKYAAAREAALGFFEAAGYTVADGKITAAPAGAKMEYECIIPAGGNGDHPNFMVLTLAKDELAKIGFNLIVTDVSDGTATISKNLESGTAEMWTMAWSATVDPDMYQIYYSDVADHEGWTAPSPKQNPAGGPNQGGSNGYYCIADEELDELILTARQSADNSYRKVLYKAALDIVVDWATEIPIYQRQNCVMFSTERINMSTMTPDITTYWGWMAEIETLEMN